MGAKAKIRAFLLQNVGKVLTSDQISAVAISSRTGKPSSEWARRLRELRDEEGLQILTHNDHSDLKPGEYLLVSAELKPAIAREISGRLRAEILERNGFTCQICGASVHDPDGLNPKRMTRLVIDHVIPIEQGGTNDRVNLRVLCAACNSGRKNLKPAAESVLDILARIRRLPRDQKKELFAKLKSSFASFINGDQES